MQRIFQHVVAAIDLTHFLAVGQRGAVAGGREERADAGAGGADTLGQVALGHQFQLDLAAAVQAVEDLRVHLARERADDFAHAVGAQQGGQAGGAIACVVVDDDQVLRALLQQGVDQFHGLAGRAEAADHDGGAVGYVREGGRRACNKLRNHDVCS
ncbi:hypothetical protein D9M68_663590 [compost metagenome]